jgi:hypothetical protein
MKQRAEPNKTTSKEFVLELSKGQLPTMSKHPMKSSRTSGVSAAMKKSNIPLIKNRLGYLEQ